MNKALSRRTLLKAALAGAAVSVTAPWLPHGEFPAATLDLPGGPGFHCSARVHALGKSYLQAFPAERDVRVITEMISQALVAGEPVSVIRQEFAREDVVVIDGWILARTEARHYALSYLNSV